MEVDILISSSLDKISSPCNLTTAIGVPSRAKLRLFRDPVRVGQSRVVVCCDKRTASRLRHRFSAPQEYIHDGKLLSLMFVGMRPKAHRHLEPIPKSLQNDALTTAPHKKIAARGGGKSSLIRVFPPRSRSPPVATGVECAVQWVEQVEADGRSVPGIADLYEEFLRVRKQYSDGEEKSRDSMEAKECTSPSTAKRVHNRPRPRRHSWSEEEKGKEEEKDDEEEEERGGENKHSSVRKIPRKLNPAASCEQVLYRQQHVVVSVDDVTTALNRISNTFADAPKPVERVGVVSLIAKIYVDGAAFADNQPRYCETLHRLGIVPWHATTQATVTASMVPPSTPPGEGWLRVLGRVVGLVRAFVDFGAFVQVYVAAATRERLGVSSMASAVDEDKMRDDDNGRDEGEREARMIRQVEDNHSFPQDTSDAGFATEGRYGLDLSDHHSRGRPAPPVTTVADSEIMERHHRGGTGELPIGSFPLLWLFPNGTDEGGRLAFNRHAVCGRAVHAKITLEAAARIVRDTGKVFPSERAWRWCCENTALEQGRLLTFQDFVEMCEGLKESIVDASFMSPEDNCTSTALSPAATVDLP